MTARPQAPTSHFLDRLAARIQGDVDLLEPRRPSMFEPNAEQQGIQDISLSHKAQPRSASIPPSLSGSIFQNGELSLFPDSSEVNGIAASQTSPQRNETQDQGVEGNSPFEPSKQFETQPPRSDRRVKAANLPLNSKETLISETIEIEDSIVVSQDRVGLQDKHQLPAGLNSLLPKKFEPPNTTQNEGGNIAHITGPVRVVQQRQSLPNSRALLDNKTPPSSYLMPQAFSSLEPEAVVNITIGRLEIRALHQLQPSPRPRAQASAPLSLDAYLKSKAGKA